MSNLLGRRQPLGLFVCSFTELWERLSFYSIEGILVLYLVHKIHFTDSHAFAMYSALTALLYAGTVIGGIISDKFLSLKFCVTFGLLLFLTGYILFLFHSVYSFYIAFAFMIGGNSFVKSNIATLAGSVYQENDSRRDSGFTLYYLFMNVGQTIGSAITAVTFVYIGYAGAFYVACISMLFGFLAFLFLRNKIQSAALIKHTSSKKISARAIILTLIALGLLALALPYPSAVNTCISVLIGLVVIYLIFCAIRLEIRSERYKMLALVVLYLFSALYWGFWMQVFTSTTLFFDRNVDRVVFGTQIPTTVLIFFEGLGIIIFAPFFAKLWDKLGESKFQPSFGLKFAYGFFFIFVSFGLLFVACSLFNVHEKISFWWIVASLFSLAVSELCLSAIGLSAVTKLAPKKMVSTMMGFWYLTIAAGLVIANAFSKIAAIDKGHTSSAYSLHIYKHAFLEFSVLSLFAFCILVFVTPLIKKLTKMNGGV
jgi:proton-dependent oligopeptide transporter, POT family